MTARDGKPCKKCGTSNWDKYNHCRECSRQNSLRYYRENPAKHRDKVARWVKNNPEYGRKWEHKNRERINANKRRRYAENPEKGRQKTKRWRKGNPERVRAHNNLRRARELGNGGSHTEKEWEALCEQYDNHCCYPGCERTDLHADHVVPLSRGGSNDISNIQPLCSHHNHKKHAKTIDYREKPGLLRWIQGKLFGN